MNVTRASLAALALLCSASCQVFGQAKDYRAPGVDEISLPSKFVAQKFAIKVLQPFRRADGSERFPVLYVTDSDEYFGGLSSLAGSMQSLGETQRFILVGIGYGDVRFISLRSRD